MSNHNSLASPFQDFFISLSPSTTTDECAHCAFNGMRLKRDGRIINQFLAALWKTSTACVDSTRKFQIQRCLEIMQISSVKRSIKKISIILFYINKPFQCWSYQSCSVAYAWGAERSHSNFLTSKFNAMKRRKKINKSCSTYILSVNKRRGAYRKTNF